MKALALLAAVLLAAHALADDAPLDEQASSLKFTGHAFLHDFHGEAKGFHGTAQIDPARPELVCGATLIISAAKLTTFEDARDQNMATWLNVTANPDITFELKKVTPLAGDLARATKAHPAQFAVSGMFTLNKVRRLLAPGTPATAWRDGKKLVVEGTAQINTEDHGLPEVRTLFLSVDQKVDIALHLEFELP
jgi:polyisoprenoid-binding protein YceI